MIMLFLSTSKVPFSLSETCQITHKYAQAQDKEIKYELFMLSFLLFDNLIRGRTSRIIVKLSYKDYRQNIIVRD